MTPAEIQFRCTHAPYYQKGCLGCEVRYVKFLRPSREKQNAFLAGLPKHRAEQVIEILKSEAK